jgi:PelA/Pel-15E family pectate lyase
VGRWPTVLGGRANTTYALEPGSTEVRWARFYNLTNSKPIFFHRGGVIYSSFAEMAAENHVGYDSGTLSPVFRGYADAIRFTPEPVARKAE